MEVSLQAGELVGVLYDALLKQYKDPTAPETLKSLNALCVRLVFCLYAEDAGIFGRRDMFHDYLKDVPAAGIRKALAELFRVFPGGQAPCLQHGPHGAIEQQRAPFRKALNKFHSCTQPL